MSSDRRGRPLAALGEVAEIEMGQSPPGDTYNRAEHGVPLLNGPTEFGLRSPSATMWTSAPTRRAVAGDVLFCVRGSTTGRMNRADREYCIGRGIAAIRGQDSCDTTFIHGALQAELGRLLRLTTGSTFPNLSRKDLEAFEIPWPEASHRASAVAVLSALDGKIDSNRRVARLLEQVAETTFKGRFVDFVGTDALAESELGPIPRGWSVGEIARLATIRKKSTRPAETPNELFEHFSIPAFDHDRESEVVPGAAMLSAKTPLPGDDCVLVSKLNPQRWWRIWWPRPSHGIQAVCSPEFVVLVPHDRIPNTFLFALLAYDDRLRRQILGHVSGTTGSRQRVKPGEILASPACIPDDAAMQSWDAFSRPIFDLAHRLHSEVRVLGGVRDALLPRLISDRIRIPDTAAPEEAAGAVAA